MGTSKGYIAPSTPHWAQSKRKVSMYISNPTNDSIRTAASSYAKAMNTEGYSNSRAVTAIAGLASFAASARKNGYANALREIGREDLLSLNPEEAFSELTLYYANDGETIDDAIALDCISAALVVLDIQKIDDLQNIDSSLFIREMVCQFAKLKFAQLYYKQIYNKCPNLAQADKLIEQMQSYIYYTMKNELTEEMLTSINPHNLSDESIVKAVIKNGFELMEHYYGE